LLNADEDLHESVAACWRELIRERRSVVLTDWVIAETGNGLARTHQRRNFPNAVRQLRSSPRVRIVIVEATLMQRAVRLDEERPDKTWGLVDCASFIVMEDDGIKDACTTDRHFEQAGFRRLLPT
jgi:hypothetical protein